MAAALALDVVLSGSAPSHWLQPGAVLNTITARNCEMAMFTNSIHEW